MKFLIVCVLAMIVICYAGKFGKLRKTDFHSLDPEEFGAEDAWANDAWGDEEWPSEPYQKPSNGWEESYQKPLKGWEEPLVVEKKVPVYVPVPVEHVRTIVKHHPVYIKEKQSAPSIFIRKVTHYKHH